jgi:hypothetical protein
MSDELRILRDRLAAMDDAFDNSQGGGETYGSAALLAQVSTTGQTNPQVFFALVPLDVDGTETEGSPATYVPQTGTTVYGLNLGSQVPPQGTNVVLHAVGGRFCFRYDG